MFLKFLFIPDFGLKPSVILWKATPKPRLGVWAEGETPPSGSLIFAPAPGSTPPGEAPAGGAPFVCFFPRCKDPLPNLCLLRQTFPKLQPSYRSPQPPASWGGGRDQIAFRRRDKVGSPLPGVGPEPSGEQDRYRQSCGLGRCSVLPSSWSCCWGLRPEATLGGRRLGTTLRRGKNPVLLSGPDIERHGVELGRHWQPAGPVSSVRWAHQGVWTKKQQFVPFGWPWQGLLG